MNQPISGVKSTLYDGLNKQPNLLGKINPKCVLSYIYPALGVKNNPHWVVFNPVFFSVCRVSVHFCAARMEMERHHIFMAYFTKKLRFVFTQIKANLLQIRLSS